MYGKLSENEKKLISTMQADSNIKKMHSYPHHGSITVFDHSMNVVMTSLHIAKKLSLTKEQCENIIIGGMLHDFFLYDWHEGRIRKDGIHCWLHPKVALYNADKLFRLNKNQRNIIRSHMFPATLLHPPICREAWIVSTADKICAVKEYFSEKKK